jgi:hypothetical protein
MARAVFASAEDLLDKEEISLVSAVGNLKQHV